MVKGRLTIKDIARLVNVSDSTVSRVLNNNPEVSEETRRMVLGIVEKYGYRRDNIARTLVTGRSNIFAFVTEDIRNPFFAEVARGVEDSAGSAGYHVIYCSTDGNVEKEKMYLEILLGYRVSGVVFTSFSGESGHLEPLRRAGVAVVLVNRYFDNIQSDCVVVDNFRGGYDITRHLIKLGHRHIAHLGGGFDSSTSLERRWGYEKAIRDHGLTVDENIIIKGDLKYKTAYEKTMDLLRRSDITAIFAANDLMALGGWQASLEIGKDVPNDIAIVGFDDIDIASFPNIGLTTVSQPKYDMGRLSVDLLLKRIDSHTEENFERIVLEPRLIVRRSCGSVTS